MTRIKMSQETASTELISEETTPPLDLTGLRVAIVLPAYNEEATIAGVIADFHKHAPYATIYVVDNNSKDRTSELARKAFADGAIKGKVIFVRRQGKANAVRQAFREIDADIYVMADADLTYPASDLEKVMRPVVEGRADMVVGDRLSGGHYQGENKRSGHEFGNRLVINLINTLFHAQLSDVMSGYRVMNRLFVKHFPILFEGFELETETTLFALDRRFRVEEVQIGYRDRPEGSVSKLDTFWDGARVLMTIFHILKHHKPMLFFGWISGILIAISLALGSLPIYEFILTGYIYRIPTAILASGTMILGFLMFGIGLILDTIKAYDRANFELALLGGSSRDGGSEES